MMRFSILGSGSSGNATYVETAGCRMLIDCGLSAREIEKRLAVIGRGLAELDLVILSHEHDDHSRGLEALTRLRPVTVAASHGTLKALRRKIAPGADRVETRPGALSQFADLAVEPFLLPHDAAEPVGFRLRCGAASLGHLTDFGGLTAAMRAALQGLTALVIESNHDVDMLRSGPYPARLKKRILGPYGHLSNDALCEFLRDSELAGLELLVLAHLSRTNNRPDLALASASLALAARLSRIEIQVAPAYAPTPLEAAAGRRDPRLPGAALAAPATPAPGGTFTQLRLSFEEVTN